MAERKRGRGRTKRPRVDNDNVLEGSAPPPMPVNYTRLHPSMPQDTGQFSEAVHNAGEFPPSAGIMRDAYGFKNEIEPRAPLGKVAIPALRTAHPPTASGKGSKRGRTSHACDACRKAKAGCTGGQPCQRCGNAGTSCIYGDGKRDKDRKRLTRLGKEARNLNRHNSDVTEALRQARSDSSLSMDELKSAIDQILSMNPAPVSDEGSASPVMGQSQDPDQGASSDEADAADFGSTGSLDVINVDTDRDETRATGHVGKAASVAWTKRIVEESQKSGAPPTAIGHNDQGFTLASYHTEEADFRTVDTSHTNPYEWPGANLADALVECYFDHVHNALPIVDKFEFMQRYHNFVRGSSDLSIEEVIWLGTLNAIFAISSVHSILSKQHHETYHEHHFIFCARAKLLCMNEDILYQDARISTTRTLGLLCLYYITITRLNRAWIMCGLAIRQAITLGLHVRSEAEDLSDVEKEQRIRLWWSLYSLECLLNELTGRPTCISDRDLSVPLPLNINEDQLVPGQRLFRTDSPVDMKSGAPDGNRGSRSRQSATYQMPSSSVQPLPYSFPIVELPATTSSYFIYRTQLTIVSHEIITELYCAATSKERWSEVQDTMRRIEKRLHAWRESLPDELNMELNTWTAPSWDDTTTAPRIGLAMMYNSSHMILLRPCLCRFEGRMTNQSEESKKYNKLAAENCVHSAREMISLIQWSAESLERLYSITPWWNILHYLCEALSVLMLEMAFRAQHLPDEVAGMVHDAKKGVNWLRTMSAHSVSARKAWEIFDSLLRVVAPLINWSIYDMPADAPVPPGYNYRRYSEAAASFSQGRTEDLTAMNLAHNFAHLQQSEAGTQRSNPVTVWNDQQQTDSMVHTSGYGEDARGIGAQSFGDQMVSNPLDHTSALERFSFIGNVRGQYDEPWQQDFGLSSPVEYTMAQPHVGSSGQMGTNMVHDPSLIGQRSAHGSSSAMASSSGGSHAKIMAASDSMRGSGSGGSSLGGGRGVMPHGSIHSSRGNPSTGKSLETQPQNYSQQQGYHHMFSTDEAYHPHLAVRDRGHQPDSQQEGHRGHLGGYGGGYGGGLS